MNNINRNSPRKPRTERNAINTDQVCNHLSWLFNKATENMGKVALRGSELHRLQVEFCYYVDEIKRGPKYIIPKVIADCNEFIADING
jgi:hypothetical protein